MNKYFRQLGILAVGIVIGILAVIAVMAFLSERKTQQAAKQRNSARDFVLQVLGTPSQTVRDQATADGWQIGGDEKFQLQIARSLMIVSHNAPAEYTVLTNNLRAIQVGQKQIFPQMNPPTCFIDEQSAHYSVTWAAAYLIRSGTHASWYHEFQNQHPQIQVPVDAWFSRDQRKQSARMVLDAARRFGAPDDEVEYLDKTFKQEFADPPAQRP